MDSQTLVPDTGQPEVAVADIRPLWGGRKMPLSEVALAVLDLGVTDLPAPSFEKAL